MGKIIGALLIAIVMVQLVSCGKTVKNENKSYPTVKVITKGAFLYCKWYGQLETCVFERQICTRNWILSKPVFKCFIKAEKVYQGPVPEPTAPPTTSK